MEKTWAEFFSRLDEMAFEEFDLIVAVGNGGIIPAGFIRQKLKIPMKIVKISYRDESNKPKYGNAKLLEEKEFGTKDARILLVDDVSRTGKTLQAAKGHLKGNKIKTCLINGKADYSFYNVAECIKMPWKR